MRISDTQQVLNITANAIANFAMLDQRDLSKIHVPFRNASRRNGCAVPGYMLVFQSSDYYVGEDFPAAVGVTVIMAVAGG